jgi:Phage integrase, N-terminal SAM-like domain
MTTAAPSTALATIQPAFTGAERLALAGFLFGYRGLTREAYPLDMRQFTTWCRTRSLALFAVRRADIESFARELEARGRARATVTRRLSTIAGFYKYAVEEELLDHSPAAHVRRPRVDYESHAAALDRNEPGALLVAAGLGPPPEHALISLLALNGLRVSEATGADIEHLGLERGHRTLTITRKGGKVVTIPPRRAPPGRSTWPSGNAPAARYSWPRTDSGWTGTAPGGSSAAPRVAPGSERPSRRTRSGMPSLPPRWMPGCRCGTCRRRPRTRTRAPRCGMTAPAAAWTGTPPASSPPTSQAPPGNTPAGTASPGGQPPGEAAPARRSGHFPVVTPCDPRVNGNRYERQQESRRPSAGAHRTDIRRALPRAGAARPLSRKRRG